MILTISTNALYNDNFTFRWLVPLSLVKSLAYLADEMVFPTMEPGIDDVIIIWDRTGMVPEQSNEHFTKHLVSLFQVIAPERLHCKEYQQYILLTSVFLS